jgi:nucleoside-diphosphate-sugar epimerase
VAILVIGSNGYLGSALINHLSHFHRIIEFDLPMSYLTISRNWILENDINLVVNTAYLPVHDNINESQFLANMHLPLHLANTLIEMNSNIPLIHFSTREVIGSTFKLENVSTNKDGVFYPSTSFDELSELKPKNLYGMSKLISEELILKYNSGVVIRLATPYTDTFEKNRGGLVSRLCYMSKHSGIVTLANGGKQVRDPIHIQDIARLILIIFKKNISQLPKLYCVGGGIDNIISLKEICTIANPEVEIIESGNGDFGFTFNNLLVTKTFSWTPEVKIRERIKQSFN